ncbi:MAG: extracellular solute-binding protein [Egibacteraceae bacterium]
MTLTRTTQLALALLLLTLAACGGGGGDSSEGGTGAAGGESGGTGPITIWYSNNENEVAWGEARVQAWNEQNPDQQVTAQEIPAGASSEAVIRAAITAGNAPCLIYNTAPAAVPSFHQQQGLVALDEFEGAVDFVKERVGESWQQYQSQDGKLYQMPWKANPVMIIYNKDLFEQAGLDPENPPLNTFDEFRQTAQTLVEETDAQAAIYPAPTSQFFQSWFDFYPVFAAETGGEQLVVDGEAQFDSEAGIAVAEFWASLYEEGLALQEEAQGDSFAKGVSAMNAAGPWAVDVYTDVNWGVVPPPTSDGTPDDETYTFSDAKAVGLYTACENRQSAWEFLKFTMSEESDQALLEATGQMPMRQGLTDTFSSFFEENPTYMPFAQMTDRMVEVPVVPNSIEVWQTFRDAYSASVIFDDQQVEPAMNEAASTIESLVSEGG